MYLPLFVKQDFTMHSGGIGHWKIECDALSNHDLATLAFMMSEILPPFGSVYGIPRGGRRIGEAMLNYQTQGPRLVVDDVLTTGGSVLKEMRDDDIGAVIFARGPCPSHIVPLFQMTLPYALFYDIGVNNE